MVLWPFDSKPPVAVLYTLLAVAGGVANYLSAYLRGGDFDLRHLLAHAFVSGFSGLMFAQFATFLGVTGEVQFMFAGIGGFLGTKAVDIVADRIMERAQGGEVDYSKGDNAKKTSKKRRRQHQGSRTLRTREHLSRDT